MLGVREIKPSKQPEELRRPGAVRMGGGGGGLGRSASQMLQCNLARDDEVQLCQGTGSLCCTWGIREAVFEENV